MRATGASALVSALAGCSQVALSKSSSPTESRTVPDELNFAAGWRFQSEKPILEYSVLSATDTEEMVSTSLLETQADAERVKWDYLNDISTDFTTDFADTAFDQDEFLVVVEVLLPKSHTIDAGETSYDGDRLHLKYDIVPSDKSGKEVTFNNSLEKWRAPKPPSEITVKLCYPNSEN